MDNVNTVMEFILMDITTSRELHVLQGLMFLLAYLGALNGNFLTAVVIVTNLYLHIPMYFFIDNLSHIDLCCISVTVSKMIVNSLTGNKLISLPACAAKIFLFIFFILTELAFLVVVAHDHYIAICHPLYYGLTITPHLCTQAAGGSWASGLVYTAIHTDTIVRLSFSGSNVIHRYFCDIPQILRISSSDIQFSESVFLSISACMGLICCSFLIISYINIFSMLLRMQSIEAHNKVLSTCTPKLAILLLFAISGLIAVLGPMAYKASLKNLLTAVFYNTVPPNINPLIYSLQNREINNALGRTFNRYFEFQAGIFLIKKFLKTKFEREIIFKGLKKLKGV